MLYFIEPRRWNEFHYLAKRRVTDIYVIDKPTGLYDNNARMITRHHWYMFDMITSKSTDLIEFG